MTPIPKILLSTRVAAATAASMLVATTAFAQLQVPSDILTVTFDGVSQTRTIFEQPGESVTADLSFTYQPVAAGDFQPGQSDAELFLIQHPIPEGIGIQSDFISFRVDGAAGRNVRFILGSDQDPGRANFVHGVVETGQLQNVTANLFPGGVQDGSTGFYTVNGHTIQVLAQSDLAEVSAVPEPETYALMLGSLGALGLVARRRKAECGQILFRGRYRASSPRDRGALSLGLGLDD